MTDRSNRFRASLHGHYWYVDDFDLQARRERDYRTDADGMRWLCGNYFKSESQCVTASRHIHEVIAAVHEATDAS